MPPSVGARIKVVVDIERRGRMSQIGGSSRSGTKVSGPHMSKFSVRGMVWWGRIAALDDDESMKVISFSLEDVLCIAGACGREPEEMNVQDA